MGLHAESLLLYISVTEYQLYVFQLQVTVVSVAVHFIHIATIALAIYTAIATGTFSNVHPEVTIPFATSGLHFT